MPTARWNGQIVAQSDDTVVVEGNHYFPPESVNPDYLQPNDRQTSCPWKGVAGYYDLVVDGQCNEAAAWFYANPKDAAAEIKGRIAFWRGVEVA